MKKTVQKILPPKNMFNGVNVGRTSFRPLKHEKDGTHLTDIEYLELLGRKAKEIEENNPNKDKGISVNFKKMGYDPDTIVLAKCVCEAIDEGRPTDEINAYIKNCVDYSQLYSE